MAAFKRFDLNHNGLLTEEELPCTAVSCREDPCGKWLNTLTEPDRGKTMTEKIYGDGAFRRESLQGSTIENTYAGALSFMRRRYTCSASCLSKKLGIILELSDAV